MIKCSGSCSKVLILDFGSQYTQLIARRIRELKTYCEIIPCTSSLKEIKDFNPDALILSGGPASVYDAAAPKVEADILSLGKPLLGICYGMQWLAQQLGGKVARGTRHEYGPAKIHITQGGWLGGASRSVGRSADRPADGRSPPRQDPPGTLNVWMSHGDYVERVPDGFHVYAESHSGLIAAMGNLDRKIFGLQFHPEVTHTEHGERILHHFLHEVAGLTGDWSMKSFVEAKSEEIRRMVGSDRVLCAVSGGVDSSVMAALLHRAIGDQLVAFFVDNGVLRKDEVVRVPNLLRENLGIQLDVIDARERFLRKLAGVTDPEEKRKRIGREFIAVFEEEAAKFSDVKFLAQGTLYPDVIESVSFKGPSATIKSHHNVGGLPEKMQLKLLEPFRELFKDEVRAIGKLLGVPAEIISRQPFPGPGLAVRILGEVTEERLSILREADALVVSEFKQAGLYTEIWQSFAVLLPVKTVGVMGDARTYENVLAIRAVESTDGMTANVVEVPYELLQKISARIINEVRGVNRVVYDISSKPPATIEWE